MYRTVFSVNLIKNLMNNRIYYPFYSIEVPATNMTLRCMKNSLFYFDIIKKTAKYTVNKKNLLYASNIQLKQNKIDTIIDNSENYNFKFDHIDCEINDIIFYHDISEQEALQIFIKKIREIEIQKIQDSLFEQDNKKYDIHVAHDDLNEQSHKIIKCHLQHNM